jgi:hypothetical protein
MPSISLAAKACKGLLRSMTLQAIGALGTACSVVEGLAVVPGQIDTGPLHLDETARLPHQVGEGRALGVVALDAHLQRPQVPNPAPDSLRQGLTDLVRYRHEYLSGDEKGESQVFLGRALTESEDTPTALLRTRSMRTCSASPDQGWERTTTRR